MSKLLVVVFLVNLHLTVVMSGQETRIVGGSNAVLGMLPYQASLRYVLNDNVFGSGHYCGGTLINNHTILTAAHCLTGEHNVVMNPKYIKVVGGHVNRFWNNGSTYVGVASRIVVHENYNSLSLAYDIGLIILSTPVPENHPTFKPANLATVPPAINSSCVISGWGHLKFEGAAPAVLQVTEVLLYDRRLCEAAYLVLQSTVICAGRYEGGIDSCQGDSGGPLMCGENLAGIVSSGLRCAEAGWPGIYTDVRQFTKWIVENKSSHAACSTSVLLLATIFVLFDIHCS